MLYGIAFVYLLFFLGILNYITPLDFRAVLTSLVCFFLLSVASLINNEFSIIEEKVASFVSYNNYIGLSNTLTFKVQYFLAYIPFALFDFKYSAHALNIGLQSFTFAVGVHFIFFNRPKVWMFIFIFFPAYYHYALFGLRDPLISILTVMIAIIIIYHNQKPWVITLSLLSMAVLAVGIRPEFAVMIFGFLGIYYYFRLAGVKRGLLVLAGLVSLYVVLLFLPLAFGLHPSGNIDSNIQQIIAFNESRNDRRLGGDGSGSHILGGALFSYPFYIRYPIQVLTNFVSPLPWEIRNVLTLLSFLESIVFSVVAYLAFRSRHYSPEARLLFLFGITYILVTAIFSFNYGNNLRIRYPCFVLFLSCVAIGNPYIFGTSRQRTTIRLTWFN